MSNPMLDEIASVIDPGAFGRTIENSPLEVQEACKRRARKVARRIVSLLNTDRWARELGPGHDPGDCDVCQEEARLAQRGLGAALARLRDDGWMVAVHNDYRLDGERKTFWLFTKSNGTYIKGEGETDLAAIMEAAPWLAI